MRKKFDLVIGNVRLIDPANGIDEVRDIYVKDGRIIDGTVLYNTSCATECAAEKSITAADKAKAFVNEAEVYIDGTNLVATPGLVDVHVHFRDPGQTHKEDIHTGSLAAAAGGYTSVVLMANTSPSVDNVNTLKYVKETAAREDINIYSCATVTNEMKGEILTDFNSLYENGAVGFTDDGKPIMDASLLEEAFTKIAALDVPVSLHEENPSLITENGINSDIAPMLNLKGSPRQAEISLIERDIEIAAKTGVTLNIQHISTKEGVELIRNIRKTHPNIHAEATPHHFSLTQEAVLEHKTLAKMNPPLRLEEDKKAIIQGLADGTIEIIATDHAPHSQAEKSQAFEKAPSGIIGLETALALGITNLVRPGHLSLPKLIEKMSVNPAKLYHLPAGSLGVGDIADIVILAPDEEWEVKSFCSKSSNSPFIGSKLFGKVKYTICRGRLVVS